MRVGYNEAIPNLLFKEEGDSTKCRIQNIGRTKHRKLALVGLQAFIRQFTND